MGDVAARLPDVATRAAGLGALAGRRILVTGVTGFIGAHVARLGAAAGAEVIAAGRRSASIAGVRDVLVDLTDAGAVRAIVRDVRPDGALHLAAAGVAPDGDLTDMMRVNIAGTGNLLRALRAVTPGAPITLAGSGYEYAPQDRPITEGDPLEPVTPYGVSKAAAAMLARIEGRDLATTVLRLFNVYGPGERASRLLPSIVLAARAGRPVELSAASQIRDFVYVEDAAEAMWRSLLSPAAPGTLRTFNLGSGIPVVLRDFIETIAAALEERGIRAELRFGALPMRAGEPAFYVADARRFAERMQWMPATSLEAGVRASIASVS